MSYESTMSLRQVSEPCPGCGSMYRRGDHCNSCRAFAPAPPNVGILPDGNDPAFTLAGHAPRGQGWDPVQHKVIRRNI